MHICKLSRKYVQSLGKYDRQELVAIVLTRSTLSNIGNTEMHRRNIRNLNMGELKNVSIQKLKLESARDFGAYLISNKYKIPCAGPDIKFLQ